MECVESPTLPGARYLDLPYRIILTKERRKGSRAWIAIVDELPGCEARGDSAEEAVQAVREEMASWMASALEEGRAIPRPRAEPGEPASGRLVLEIPQSLHEALVHAAVREGITVSQLVTFALAGTIHWRPGDSEANARWIESRSKPFTRDGSRHGLRRAIFWNAALLVIVALAAVGILVAAVMHGF
jgi:predicted RNase H-like HicB family nuclease